MNKRQKEFLQFTIEEEKRILADLKKVYEKAEKDIDAKIAALLARNDEENLQSIIYQVDYQRALKRQIGAILDELNNKQFESISQYLTECYENGFIGTLYDLQGQGIPLIFPINQEEVVRAIVHNTKLSKRLYTSLGEDVDELKKRIRSELSRGISQAYTYEKIAKNIRNQTSIGFNKSMRIVRTEGHRITQEATFDAQHKAKDAGADIVKQWDSTLDGRTRELHNELDGQIRELDEPFTVGVYSGQYPGGFGAPEMDIHCRCVLLQRARWALEGGSKPTKYDGNKGALVDWSDAKNYADFKARYGGKK
jgi:SPP1 gp7 family putative phage head morphogenesis protein